MRIHKGQTEQWRDNLLAGELSEENQSKKSKDVIGNAPYLMKNNKKFFPACIYDR